MIVEVANQLAGGGLKFGVMLIQSPDSFFKLGSQGRQLHVEGRDVRLADQTNAGFRIRQADVFPVNQQAIADGRKGSKRRMAGDVVDPFRTDIDGATVAHPLKLALA